MITKNKNTAWLISNHMTNMKTRQTEFAYVSYHGYNIRVDNDLLNEYKEALKR